jgi:MoaA/NifB/PqqE/SkfB family radical SAM enzyme
MLFTLIAEAKLKKDLKNETLSSPLMFKLELTEACNQICRHCYNYWRQERKPPSGELATEQFLNIARQIHSAKVGGVTLTGGEPMLRKEVLFAMVSEFHNLGIDVGMNSNGALVTNEDARTLKQCGLDHALISVLGPESVHNLIAGPGGDFKKTTNGIINLLEAGIYVAVNMPVSHKRTFIPYLKPPRS